MTIHLHSRSWNIKRTFLHPHPSNIFSQMTDSPPDPFAFEPIPSATRRRDGWTAERQRGFIAALAGIGMVEAAANSVGMSRKSAYDLLERAGPGSGAGARPRQRLARRCGALERRRNPLFLPWRPMRQLSRL